MCFKCLYFAYGSNMNPERLKGRIKKASSEPLVLAIGKLKDYEPKFTRYSKNNKGGSLDIVKSRGSCIYGIIYGIKKEDLKEIDKAEGVPNSYRRIRLSLLIEKEISTQTNFKKNKLKCYTYEVIEKEPKPQPPSQEYMSHVRVGKLKYGVNIEKIEEIIKEIGYSN